MLDPNAIRIIVLRDLHRRIQFHDAVSAHVVIHTGEPGETKRRSIGLIAVGYVHSSEEEIAALAF